MCLFDCQELEIFQCLIADMERIWSIETFHWPHPVLRLKSIDLVLHRVCLWSNWSFWNSGNREIGTSRSHSLRTPRLEATRPNLSMLLGDVSYRWTRVYQKLHWLLLRANCNLYEVLHSVEVFHLHLHRRAETSWMISLCPDEWEADRGSLSPN